MTHDHLLAEINDAILYQGEKQVWKALRAVVEFHRPIKIKDMMIYCQGCSNSALIPWESCLTIKAIKRELG
jgi:hypothetical protein